MKEVGGIYVDRINEQVETEMKNENSPILQYSVTTVKDHGILLFPEAIVNNITYYGIFKAPEIFEMICQSLSDPPS
mgnify:CR=1 FL=1